MKKLGVFLVSISFLFSGQIKAQSFYIGMIDNALGLLDKGKQKESSQILGTAMGLLTKNAQGSTGDFASKILSQAGSLSKLLPALESNLT